MSASARPILVGREEIGSVAVFATEEDGAPWSYLGVENADLAVDSLRLAKGELRCWKTGGESHKIQCGMTTIENLFAIGPTHDLIGHLAGRDPRGAFEFHPLADNRVIARDISLWEANCKTQKRLIAEPTHKGVVVRPELSQRMRQKKSKLHYRRGMRWTSQALLAASTKDEVLGGSAWTTLGHADARVQKAFALWANGALGMMVHWTRGQRTQKGRSTTQIGALRQIPCPDLARLPDAKLENAARSFDELAGLELKPACQAHCDANRKRVDEAILEMLSLPTSLKQTIEKLRAAWCAEPSVHGNHKTALKLLSQSNHGIDTRQ